MNNVRSVKVILVIVILTKKIKVKLDYNENINEFGENVVRLYNFDKAEAIKFSSLIKEIIIDKKQKLDLSTINFIEPRNCNLILGAFRVDEGILTDDNETFYCVLTLKSYEKMIELMEPFCEKNTKGYQYLYEVDNLTDFLFSPAGTW